MGGDALLFEQLHQEVGHAVVDGAFAGDGAFFEAVIRGGVILIGDDDKVGVLGRVDLLGFSFVELFLFHIGRVLVGNHDQ